MISTKKPGSPQELVLTFSLEKPGSPQDLVHFGIKGMHWGVRKERETSDRKSAQSKPISEKKERKAKEFEARAGIAQKEINRIRANPSKWTYIQNQRNEQVRALEAHRDQQLKDAKAVREGHLTSSQRKVIIGASVAAGVLAAYGTYKFIDSGTAHQLLDKETFTKKNDLLNRKMSPDAIWKEVVKPINPNYGELGTQMNCRRCTFAYEARRRGYDVKATNTIMGSGQLPAGLLRATDPKSHLNTTLPGHYLQTLKKGSLRTAMETTHGLGKEKVGGETFMFQSASDKAKAVFDAMGKHPEGARGELGLEWKMGGAHSMAWEIIGGKPHIFDTQTSITYTQQEFSDILGKTVNRAGITRLDNVDLNTNFLKRWVRNVE